jgi:biopolymer transport protein ExbD
MKRISNQRQLRLINEISITPFLDVVLVLLFVFVLAAPLMKTNPAWLPAAPSSAPSTTAAPAEKNTLLVNRDLSVTLNGAMLARAALPFSLEVRIHRDLSVQQLVEIMGVLEENGIQKTAVTTHADDP